MAAFRVLQPGLFTTIQDLGRYGYESQGVPTSGAMDEFAFRVANILLGNEENAPALEITMLGPTLEVLEDVAVAITGAQLPVEVNGKKRTVWTSFPLKKGDVLSLGAVKALDVGHILPLTGDLRPMWQWEALLPILGESWGD